METAIPTHQDPNFANAGQVPVPESRGERKGSFRNYLFSSDSLTECSAFISEIKAHQKGDETMYFARLGLIQGSEEQGGERRRKVGNNIDVLVGKTLRGWAAANIGDHLKSLTAKVKIRNLVFEPVLVENKAHLNNRGILETVEFGYLDQ